MRKGEVEKQLLTVNPVNPCCSLLLPAAPRCSFRNFKQECLVVSSKNRTFVPDYNNNKYNTTSNKIQHKNNNNNIK